MKTFQRIRDLREDSDLTQEQAAKIGFISKNTYIRYEKGETSIPLDVAVIYAKYYNVSLDYIAGITNNKEGTGLKKEIDYITKKEKSEKALKKITNAVNEF